MQRRGGALSSRDQGPQPSLSSDVRDGVPQSKGLQCCVRDCGAAARTVKSRAIVGSACDAYCSEVLTGADCRMRVGEWTCSVCRQHTHELHEQTCMLLQHRGQVETSCTCIVCVTARIERAEPTQPEKHKRGAGSAAAAAAAAAAVAAAVEEDGKIDSPPSTWEPFFASSGTDEEHVTVNGGEHLADPRLARYVFTLLQACAVVRVDGSADCPQGMLNAFSTVLCHCLCFSLASLPASFSPSSLSRSLSLSLYMSVCVRLCPCV